MSASSHITLTNQLGELARANQWLGAWAEAHCLSERLRFSLRLCMEEVLANIVMHGYDHAAHDISLSAECEGNEAVLTFVDSGKSFNPLAAPASLAPESLDAAEIGGHGLMLVRSFASRLDYQRIEPHNRLTLAVRLEDDRPAPGR